MKEKYNITFNYSKKTYTIRKYVNGKLDSKYRSYPQGKNFSTSWTENDIKNFLHYADSEYYVIK